MTKDTVDALLQELRENREQKTPQSLTNETPGRDHSSRMTSGESSLNRSFTSEYLDELIIVILFRCGEANGMDIIRELAHTFGVQLSPGTVYPHLHSLEEEGILARRESVQTKEYRIESEAAARETIESTLTQLVHMVQFLDSA